MIFARAGVIVPTHRADAISRRLKVVARKFAMPSVAVLLDELGMDREHPAWPDFISIFTINHTAFYREAHHFTHLAGVIQKQRTQVRIWTAAVSTGEEAYTIAMTVLDTLGSHTRLIYPILATDIDEKAVAFAKRGEYEEDRIKDIGVNRLKSYCLKGVGRNEGKVKIRPFVAEMIHFDVFNLNQQVWPDLEPFDAVFCRNVMIYFSHDAQIRLMERFAKVVKPGGFLYVGHSENMVPLTRQFKLIGQSIYQRVG